MGGAVKNLAGNKAAKQIAITALQGAGLVSATSQLIIILKMFTRLKCWWLF